MDFRWPYCHEEIDICHDDGFGYDEGVLHEIDCDSCGKSFVFQTEISFHFEPKKADCLNDGNHEYKSSTTFPIEYTEMECIMCDKRRKPTDAEWKVILKK